MACISVSRLPLFASLRTVRQKQCGLSESAPVAPALTRYTLEGELSCSSGAGEANVRFLLVTRLYRSGDTRALIGQWAGTADSLRSLTVNLRRAPRVHVQGLVGEVGSRILACLQSDLDAMGTRWQLLLPRLARPNVAAEIVSAEAQARPLRQARTQEAFRLRLPKAAARRAFLLTGNQAGELHLAHLSEGSECLSSDGRQTALSLPIALPEDTVKPGFSCKRCLRMLNGRQRHPVLVRRNNRPCRCSMA